MKKVFVFGSEYKLSPYLIAIDRPQEQIKLSTGSSASTITLPITEDVSVTKSATRDIVIMLPLSMCDEYGIKHYKNSLSDDIRRTEEEE